MLYFERFVMSLFAGFLLLVTASPVVASTIIVLKSTDESLTVGTRLDGSAEMSLPAGSHVTFLAESGKIVRLKGPWTGVVTEKKTVAAGAGSQMFAAVTSLVNKEKEELSSLGAVRDTGLQNLRDPWIIDVKDQGHFCLPAGTDSPEMYRSDAADDVKLTLARKGGGVIGVNWEAKSNTKQWPGQIMKIDDDVPYMIALGKEQYYFRFHQAKEELSDDGEILTWLMANNCTSQAVRFMAAL